MRQNRNQRRLCSADRDPSLRFFDPQRQENRSRTKFFSSLLDLIWVRREANYFCKWDWTGTSVICPPGKLLAAAGSSSSTVGLLPERGCPQFSSFPTV
jgi:hypothetical protein